MSKYSPSDCQCLRWTVLVVSLPQNSLKHTIQQLTWTSWDLHFHHPEIILYHQEPWRTYTKVKHDSQCSSLSVGFWLKLIRFWVSVSEEVIIIVHHQVWHWPNIGSTRAWFWWRQWLNLRCVFEMPPPGRCVCVDWSSGYVFDLKTTLSPNATLLCQKPI